MISVDTARKIILSMPEAEEQQHHGHPDFRIRKRIFATLWPDEKRAVIKVSDLSAWSHVASEAFSTNAWSKHGWTNVHLQHVDTDLFRELVEDSWFSVAPKVVAAKLFSERSAPREH